MNIRLDGGPPIEFDGSAVKIEVPAYFLLDGQDADGTLVVTHTTEGVIYDLICEGEVIGTQARDYTFIADELADMLEEE